MGAQIVKIRSAEAAGVYTVGWQTLGGCDPGAGTSGMAGEVTLTVEAAEQPDDTPAPGELTGTPALAVVIIRPFCVYTWSVSLVEATTDANCIVGPAPFEPNADNEINITLADPESSCTQRSRIVIRLHPAVPVGIDDTDHNAILRARFIASARRIEDAPRRCATRTGISKVDDNDTPDDTTDDTVSIELRVVATTADGEECRYDVTLRLPRRLVATQGEYEHDVFENVDPRATIDFNVGVATRTIILLQTVEGDSGDADARYELTRTCGEPDEFDLPDPLLPLPAGSGITPIGSIRNVELREGRFNITAVLAEDPSADDAFDGVTVRVLDNVGETCEATVSVTHLPDQCAAEETDLTVDLTRAAEPTIFEFMIACGDAREEPETDDGTEDSEPTGDDTDTDEDTGTDEDTDT